MTARKHKDIGGILKAHSEYVRALKQHRSLAHDIAHHIAEALPEGTSLEWTQGEAGSAMVCAYHAKENGYYLENGVDDYRDEVPGLTKAGLRTLVKVWNALPNVMMDHAYGTSIMRVSSDGTLKEV
jgi:hypothetical protein